MDAPQFYTTFAEWAKIGFYIVLMLMVLVGLYKKRSGKSPNWASWIHAAIFIHFLVGAFYSGVRMVQMDELEHMQIRRFFAWEAWFNFACASFYFLILYLFSKKRS